MELKITEKSSGSTPTLCLNMIVKNESKIIKRMLDSVLPIIDCYCICDTGSTDNTIEVIINYFDEKGIPGKIIKEPFKNFAHNRTFALKQAAFMSDFVLLMDADMVLDIRSFKKEFLKDNDVFTILQGNNSFYYYNSRIVKNNGECNYVGVTHEYIDTPPQYKTFNLEKDVLFIYDIGDGGSKENKYKRDEMLLLEGLKEDPNNARYHFYLANTYYDIDKFQDAITHYETRIKLGGWKEEVWFSHYKLGLCYKKLGRLIEAFHWWMEGFQFYPERLEGVYEMLVHYRTTNKFNLFETFYNSITKILDKNHNRNKYLFLHNDVYSYKIYYEFTIVAFYLGINNVSNEVVTVLNNCNDTSMINGLFSNLKFYNLNLVPLKVKNFDNRKLAIIDNEYTNFTSSSSSLIPDINSKGYIMNVRYVNYVIGAKGQYFDCDDNIITQNKMVKLDNELNVIGESCIPLKYTNKKYIGIEDVKLFRYQDNILFIGTVLKEDGTLGLAKGNYDYNRELTYTELTQNFNRTTCEKNWTYVTIDNELYIVYSWSPLKICSLNEDTNEIKLKYEINMPLMYKHIRGSTCGYQYDNEIWFISHISHYSSPREYYHIISVFDKNMKLIRHSAPFKFEGESIEFCLSIVVEENRVLINYSTWDRTTRIGIYDKTYIDSIVCYQTNK